MSEVRVETHRGVMTVTLADVENRNALGAGLLTGLYSAIESANADDAVSVVVVTNEGNTFCAGANLKEQSGAKKASCSARRATRASSRATCRIAAGAASAFCERAEAAWPSSSASRPSGAFATSMRPGDRRLFSSDFKAYPDAA